MKRKFKLSSSRERFSKRKGAVLVGSPLRMNHATNERLAKEIDTEFRKMHLDFSKQIESLFDSEVARESVKQSAMDSAMLSVAARVLTNKLIAKWEKAFNSFANRWSDSMTETVVNNGSQGLSESLGKLSGGLTIKTSTISQSTREKIVASADQSASLIKTISRDYSASVKEAVARSITDGSQSFSGLKAEIHSMLQDKYKKHRNKAHNVALDQTRKAYNSITRSRMKDAGVSKFRWKHGGGGKSPRAYHKNVLNNQVFSIDDPPIINQKTGERGFPGDEINCTCYMIPVIEFDN